MGSSSYWQHTDETSSVRSRLTPQQIQQFKDDGFLIIRDLLPREAVQPLIDELAQRVEEATDEAVKQGILDPENRFDNAPFETRLAQVCKACHRTGLGLAPLLFQSEAEDCWDVHAENSPGTVRCC